jgi:hypothetical protein
MNSTKNSGTPFGNNPSGSYLGQPAVVSAGSVIVKDWYNYLSTTFGLGIRPAFSDNIEQLFTLSNTNINLQISNVKCAQGNLFRTLTGRITVLRGNEFDIVLDD